MSFITALSDLWIAALIGATILAIIIAILRWQLGNSILVTLMLWVSVLIEVIASVAYALGRTGISWSTGLIGFGGGAIVIAIIVWVIYRQILKPIRELTELAQHIALGEISGQSTYSGTSEIGRLADAFNQMTAYLQEMSTWAQRLGEGDLRVTITPRSDRDVLGHAFEEMRKNLSTLAGQVAETSERLASSSEELSSMIEEVNTSANQVT